VLERTHRGRSAASAHCAGVAATTEVPAHRAATTSRVARHGQLGIYLGVSGTSRRHARRRLSRLARRATTRRGATRASRTFVTASSKRIHRQPMPPPVMTASAGLIALRAERAGPSRQYVEHRLDGAARGRLGRGSRAAHPARTASPPDIFHASGCRGGMNFVVRGDERRRRPAHLQNDDPIRRARARRAVLRRRHDALLSAAM